MQDMRTATTRMGRVREGKGEKGKKPCEACDPEVEEVGVESESEKGQEGAED